MTTDPTSSDSIQAGDPRREEHLTASGFRIVGKGARELAARLDSPGLGPGREEDVLFAARFLVRPRLGAGSPVNGVLSILSAAISRQIPDALSLSRDRPHNIRPNRFGGLRWEVTGEPGTWMGELLWRHPHPVVAGAPCTTHLLVIEQPGRSTLHVRVTADQGPSSVRGAAGAGQARPGFLTEMARSLRLSFDGHEGTPITLSGEEIERFVREGLLSEEREYPLAVLTPLEPGGYVLPPEELADELLGLAPVYIVERHRDTYRLTDALGDRRLSAYWGALRVYLPGFSCADPPHDHPLLTQERVIDPVVRAGLVGRLARLAASRFPMPPGISDRRGEPPARQPAQAPRVPAPESEPPPRLLAAAPPSGRSEEVARLRSEIARLAELAAATLDELSRLRTTMAVRATNTSVLERRIANLEQLLKKYLDRESALSAGLGSPKAGPPEAGDAEEPDTLTLRDVLRQAGESHPDTLLILEAAERAAAESPYEDPDRVAVILDAMADVARRRQEGGLGAPLREAFRELGIDYRGGIAANTPERLRQQYRVAGPDGKTYACEEHIVLGNGYDPRRCLRIYFTSRAPLEARFVIGHVGRHFEILSST